jgi:alpha-tubulin suppressor-like RCC1 family protein
LLISIDKKLYAWGALVRTVYNAVVAVGDGSLSAASTPVNVDTSALQFKTITKISASISTAHVLTSDGTVYGMGDNQYGLVGDSTVTDQLTLTEVDVITANELAAGETVIDVKSTATATFIYTSQSRVLHWGNSIYNDISSPVQGTAYFTTPMEITVPGRRVSYVAISNSNTPTSAVILTNGCSYAIRNITLPTLPLTCDSNNELYYFGTHTNLDTLSIPTIVNIPGKKTSLQVGIGSATFAAKGFGTILDSNGIVYSYGANDDGELGDGTTTVTLVTQIKQVSYNPSLSFLFGRKVIDVICRARNCLAFTSDNQLVAWGYMSRGTETLTYPSVVYKGAINNRVISQISGGAIAWRLALTTDNKLFSWGSDATDVQNGVYGDPSYYPTSGNYNFHLLILFSS